MELTTKDKRRTLRTSKDKLTKPVNGACHLTNLYWSCYVLRIRRRDFSHILLLCVYARFLSLVSTHDPHPLPSRQLFVHFR